jgi:hypothetical protein
MRRHRRALVVAAALAVATASPAAAAPPANDARAAPESLSPPATLLATTIESTVEEGEPFGCSALGGSVYYEFRATGTDRMVVRLRAAGDLDATLEVFLRTRSQLSQAGCELTDRRGAAAVELRPERGGVYLVRVGQRAGSEPGDFRLEVFTPEPAPRGPGAALRTAGARGVLDSLERTSAAYSYRMRAGATYRVNVAASACVSASIYPPGTRNFENAERVETSGCDGYLTFTPRRGGRHSILLQAQARRNGPQRYHVQAALVGADDTAPGLMLPNLTSVRGSLRGGGIDAVDLYRFSITTRSALELELDYDGSGSAAVWLLNDGGRRLASGESGVSRRIAPGRYFAVVRTRDGGSGRYVLRRISRTITATRTTVANTRPGPGQAVRIGVSVTPGATGPTTITIERFDPLAGWQFHRQVRSTVAGGSGAITFTPPVEGRWRVQTAFEGTLVAAPSRSGWARWLTAPPLADI